MGSITAEVSQIIVLLKQLHNGNIMHYKYGNVHTAILMSLHRGIASVSPIHVIVIKYVLKVLQCI